MRAGLTDASSLYADITYSYGYDDLYRLTSAVASSTDSALTYSKTLTYGAIGNILTSTDCGTYQYLGYQAGNYANAHAVTSACGKTFTYDRSGNLLTDGTWTNTWNYRSQLTQSASASTTVTYQYDHEGNRVLKSSGSSSTIYPNSYYEVDGSDVRRHITAGALGNVATSTWNGTDSTTIYHHKDHLGGTHVETNESGAAVQYVIYKPFGETLVDQKTGTYGNDRKYTGKELDSETSWYYYGARYYDPTLGRFMSQDPLFLTVGAAGDPTMLFDPQSFNSYAYSRNNPLRFVDPDGQAFLDAFNRALQVVIKAENFVGDALTFGQFSKAFDNAGAAGQRVAKEGVSAKSVSNAAAQVAWGTTTTAAGALANGMISGATAGSGTVASGAGAAMAATIDTSATTAVKTSATAVARTLGNAGETAVQKIMGTIGTKIRIPSTTGAAYRIPDGMIPGVAVSEVKNVARQGLTGQLRDMMTYAAEHGMKFNLYVRESTALSKNLQTAVDAGKVMLHRVLP